MTPYHHQVIGTVSATRLTSSSQIFWFGKSVGPALPRALRQALSPEAIREHVRFALQNVLYRHFYCTGAASPSVFQTHETFVRSNSDPLAEKLSAANSGTGYSDPGWEVRRVEGSNVDVFRNGLDVIVRAEDCDGPAGRLIPGASVNLRIPKEFFERLPGFYVALGDRLLRDSPVAPALVRLYWNVNPKSAVEIVRLVTRRLNDTGLPFQLKVLSDPARYGRCDAAVLYLDQADFPLARGVVAETYSEVASELNPGVPAFTKRLAPGLGLAEDPGPGMSFGKHRCQLLADALIAAHELGQASPADQLRVVIDRFEREGVSLETPYVNNGSPDTYTLDLNRDPHLSGGARAAAPRRVAPGPDEYLGLAQRIGDDICREAIWSEGRCNWIGPSVDIARRASRRAFGPHLYGGTSGAALFLAELYRATGDAHARTTALGAIRQALSRADSIAPIDRVGFFDGWTGIAVAAARVGLLAEEDGLLRAAQDLRRAIEPQDPADLQCGVISGAAGAIPALLALGELLHDRSSIDHAVRLGDGLLACADKRGTRWSWKLAKVSGEMNLTGFSHGTAGVACALLELFQATGDQRYRAAAERAFEYERYWFDAEARNWPDFRGYARRAVRRHDVVPCSAYWCHGAPGIAVSRIRAYEITQDPTCKAEAMVALQTTRESTEHALEAHTMNFSLCHGLAGNAEILLLGERSLGDAFSGGARLSTEIALAAADRLTAPSPEQSLDVGGPAAGLMVGLAGLGYFYLRLENPAVPSMLFLNSRSLAATESGSRADAVRASVAMSS